MQWFALLSLPLGKCVPTIQAHLIVFLWQWLLIANQDIMLIHVNQMKIVIFLTHTGYYVKINRFKDQMTVQVPSNMQIVYKLLQLHVHGSMAHAKVLV